NVTYVEPRSAEGGERTLLARAVATTPEPQRSIPLLRTSQVLTASPLTLPMETRPELNALAAEPALTAAPSLLTVETGPISYTGKSLIRVFMNKPDATPSTSTHDPHYVGRISALDSGARANEAGKEITHTFSILLLPGNRNFSAQLRSGLKSVTLVPMTPAR